MKEKTITLCTFPDDDADYCKEFDVPKSWLLDILQYIDERNERRGVNLDNFLENYIWDETWFIYLQAKKEERLIREEEQE